MNTKITKEIGGLEVTVDARTFKDMDFIRTMTNMMKLNRKQQHAKNDDEYIDLTIQLYDTLDGLTETVFGDKLEDVKAAFREAHDGFLEFDEWLSFVMDVINSFSPKKA